MLKLVHIRHKDVPRFLLFKDSLKYSKKQFSPGLTTAIKTFL